MPKFVAVFVDKPSPKYQTSVYDVVDENEANRKAAEYARQTGQRVAWVHGFPDGVE